MNEKHHTSTPNSRRTRSRRLFVGLAVAPAVAALLAACGSEATETADTVAPTTGVPATQVPATQVPATGVPATEVPATDAPADQVEYPHDADTAVIRIEIEGGFVPPGVDFRGLPRVLIAGDGRSYSEGVTTEEYPGPLVRPVQVRTITEDGIERLLALADEAGLLGPAPDYAGAENIADAPDTVVTINANGETYVHRAYALGIDGDGTEESSPARQALHHFVAQVADLDAAVGEEALGEYEVLEPTAYRFRAISVSEVDVAAQDPAPAQVTWPDAAGVMLRDATDCAVASAEQVGALFAESKENTIFTEGDGETATLYQLAVVAQLPGDPTC